ncbi:MAG: lysylphosphatidylglycerol synthase domain-containing protein [Salinivirgaceae bacterium]
MSKNILIVLKWLAIILSCAYIAYKLWKDYQAGWLSFNSDSFTYNQWILFLASLTLVFVNWGLESVKWKLLMNSIAPISWNKAIGSVLAGVSVSIFTPNRVGEFGGRIFFLEKETRVQGVGATLVGNLAQLLTTLIIGFIGLIPFWSLLDTTSSFPLSGTTLFFISLVVIVLGLIVYFSVHRLEPLFIKLKWTQQKMHYFKFLAAYKKQLLLTVFGLSALRYLVFSIQFFLLLKLNGINLTPTVTALAISQIYLILTLVPTFALSEVGVRSSVAVLVLGVFTPLSGAVIVASVSLWIINLAFPALMGTLFLTKQRIS